MSNEVLHSPASRLPHWICYSLENNKAARKRLCWL
jgi:hypothetical protein